jgi:hypothetical protein
MRSEPRGQMPGNRATTQRDTLVRNPKQRSPNLNDERSRDHARPNAT